MWSSKLLRKVNRGIVLAIILLVGLVTYLFVDGIAFREEREAIKEVCANYIKDTQSFLILPEEYIAIGTMAPDLIIENKLKENREVINKYFLNTDRSDWSFKESVLSDLDEILKGNEASGNKVKSCASKMTRIKSITKHGANLVTIEAVAEMTTIATGGAEDFCVFTGWGSWNRGHSENTEELKFMNRAHEITFICEMVKQDGKWVFSKSEGMSLTTW